MHCLYGRTHTHKTGSSRASKYLEGTYVGIDETNRKHLKLVLNISLLKLNTDKDLFYTKL